MNLFPLLSACLLLSIGCSQSGPPATSVVDKTAGSETESCGPELSDIQILHVVKGAIAASGGDPSRLDTDYRLSIGKRGCDYVVIGIRLPETIPAEFVITFDRRGKIKSWPWCCVPGLETSLLEANDEEGEKNSQ